MELSSIEIQKIIPHRYPFLLVDKIIEIEPGKRAVGIKNVTINEPFFQGHFPGNPMMPGVLMVEALAQVSGIACGLLEESEGKIGVFTGIDNCKIRRQVVPGDTLRLEVDIVVFRRGIVKAKGKAFAGDQLACAADISFAMINVYKSQ